MSSSTQVAGKDGSWAALVDRAFDVDFPTDVGDLHLSRDKEGGPVDGKVKLKGVKVSAGQDSKSSITFGGGSQEFKVKGTLTFGKTTVNLLGGHLDLDDGNTDDFQFSFTVQWHASVFPQWTGVADDTYTEVKEVDISVADLKKSGSKQVAKLSRKDPLFDAAGVIIPTSVFKGWAKKLDFSIDISVALNGDKPAKVTATRKLHLEVRPIFQPFELGWPDMPKFPPWFDMMKRRVEQDLAQQAAELRVVLQAIEHAVQQVATWQNVERLIQIANVAMAAVTAAALIEAGAIAAAAVFGGMNPVTDAAAAEATCALTAATGEAGAAKIAVKTAEEGLAWGTEKLSWDIIARKIAESIADKAAEVVASTTLAKDAVVKGAQALFDRLAAQTGLKMAGGDLGALAKGLGDMRVAAGGQMGQLTKELGQATAEMHEGAALATRLLEYQVLLESWMATDHSRAPFLTWPDTNLRISNPSEDAEVLDVGDIDGPKQFADAATKMREYATSKGYAGFVMIPLQRKAYFRAGDAAGLLGTLDSAGYAKGMVSYVKAQHLPLEVVVNRWGAIHAASGAS